MDKQSENIKTLILDVKDKIGRPVSSRVVAATIESFGIRDVDTITDYGVDSIQDLATYVYNQIVSSPEYDSLLNDKEKEFLTNQTDTVQISSYLSAKVKIFAQYYPLGIFHLLPVFLQIVAIIIFGYSLWTHVDFNHLQSTAVVLGVIIGLIATGGFVQVIGRQASFFWNYQDYEMTRKTVNYLLKIGVKTLLVIFSIIFLINFFFRIYPYNVLTVIFVYAFLIGTLLLVLAPYHTIKQRWMISLSVLIGTAVTIYLNKFTSLKIYFTHWLGILTAIIICKTYLHFYLKKLSKNVRKKNFALNPVVFLYQNYQYFIYGVFIYIFIFTDRILAWSTTSDKQLIFIVYFEKDYELGMDLAILVFLLLAGVLEYSIASFTRFLDIYQKSFSFDGNNSFNKELKKLYNQHILLLIGSSLIIFVIIYYVVTASWGFKGQFNEELLPMSIHVCAVGSLGYLFLTWGMLNTLYLLTLGRPTQSLRAIIYASIVNVSVGFLLSRFVSLEYSVYGMLAGSLVFTVLTFKELKKFLNRLDYYYYASY